MIFDINGFHMHVERRGAGDPLLLLHGGTGIGDDFRLVFTAGDPTGFDLVVPDLRGHGRSTTPAGPLPTRQATDDGVALLDRLGISRVKAIGMSLGANPLLHIATRQPD